MHCRSVTEPRVISELHRGKSADTQKKDGFDNDKENKEGQALLLAKRPF